MFIHIVYNIGASCIKKELSTTPHWIKRENNFLGQYYGCSSLSLNHNSINKQLNLDKLLMQKPPKKRTDIFIWHDILNNSINSNKYNQNNPLSIDELKEKLHRHKGQIQAIVCNQRK